MCLLLVQKVLETTVLAALLSAVVIPYSLLKLMDKIDNVWDIATERADTAGRMLAHVLLKRPQVTLHYITLHYITT